MQKHPRSQSGLFTPRVVIASALCSCGVLMSMFSLAATPRANATLPHDPLSFQNAPSTSRNNTHRLPPGVPLPAGAQFSVNGRGDLASSSPTAGFPGFVRMPRRPEMASGADSLGNPGFANQQPARMHQPAASETTPLALPAQSEWSIVHSPNETGPVSNGILSTTCTSPSDCWAVGYGYTSPRGLPQTLIEHWDGSSWTIVPSPNSDVTQGNKLNGVTCASASECWAVGYYTDYNAYLDNTLIEHWDGTAWTIVPSPNVNFTVISGVENGNQLNGVTCASASSCWAVGQFGQFNLAIGGSSGTLIEHWDGASWSIVSSPNPALVDGSANDLQSVICALGDDCWAVGYYLDPTIGSPQTLIEHWDGNVWAKVNSPNPVGSSGSVLTSVTCVSASDCWAVGFYSNGFTVLTLIEHWDISSSSWTTVISPNDPIAVYNFLYGVACASASDCWAVGSADDAAYQTLIEHWDGTLWSIVDSANTSATSDNYLLSVTCQSVSNCWALGFAVNFPTETLMEHWDGTSWTILSSPDKPGTLNSSFDGLTCSSVSDCWMVGRYYHDTTQISQSLIEHWDGTSWTIVPSPNTSTTLSNFLNGVTCPLPSQCWAVGYSSTDTVRAGETSDTSQTLIQYWDGTSWTIVVAPNRTGNQTNRLYDVSCGSPSECWAVGYSTPGTSMFPSGSSALILRWDGASWTIANSPNTTPQQDQTLFGLTCVSAADCWAVGYYLRADAAQGSVIQPSVKHKDEKSSSDGVGVRVAVEQTLIEHWDGTKWAIVASPNATTTQANELHHVTCEAASDCWAVGYYYDGSYWRSLIEHWDGTQWSVVSSPNTNPTADEWLYSVACVSTASCWAVGYYDDHSGSVQTLIESWDGIEWTIATSPNTSTTQHNKLYGVTCVPASDCWAAGEFNNTRTLALKYSANTLLTPTSVVSRKTHGSAGAFDIDLPLTGPPGTECRTGGAGGNHMLVFTFPNNTSVASATVTSGTGRVSSSALGPNQNQYTVNLTGVTNAQYLTVTLNGVLDSTGRSGTVVGPKMGILIGDTTADGFVNSADIAQTKSKSGTPVGASNFRQDVTVDANLNSADIALVKSKSGTALP